MAANLAPITDQEALKLAREHTAFKGEFATWLGQQVSPPGESQTYVVKLCAVLWRTRLTFTLRAARGAKATLRFRNLRLDVAPEQPSAQGDFVLKETGEQGVVLVCTGDVGAVSLTVDSDKHGRLIEFPAAATDEGTARKRVYIWHFKIIAPTKMVNWFAPGQLARTALDVVVSTMFGQRADYRLMEALASETDKPYVDFTRAYRYNKQTKRDEYDPDGPERDELWLDYVGDVGDGWNSTYAVATCLAQEELTVKNPFDKEQPNLKLPRGTVLCFGGDQVYPVANRQQYQQRLVQPYETALPRSRSPYPHAFAIPGNHDWYDSLVSFTRLFCSKRWLAGWQTDQARSYYALKLPGGWWLLGTDVQLGSDIDTPQVEYFKNVAQQMQHGDHVILCTAEPHWVYTEMYGGEDPNYDDNNMAYLEKKVLGEHVHVAAFIAGDQHHYRRYAAPDGTQKITAGGGGAFMHPTHGTKVDELKSGGFKLEGCFPSTSASRRLVLKNLLFPFKNWSFGLLTGFFYLLTAWTVQENVANKPFGEALYATWKNVLADPVSVFWIVLLFLGFVMFSDPHPKWYRYVAGPLHGLAHLFVLFLLGWWATTLFFAPGPPLQEQHTLPILKAGAFMFVGGWLFGSILMGVYLLISLNGFGAHWNEATSSLSVEDYKNFLKLRLSKDGSLTIYPIGLPGVPRKWHRRGQDGQGPEFVPDDPAALQPELIEREIRLKRSYDPAGGVQVLNPTHIASDAPDGEHAPVQGSARPQ